MKIGIVISLAAACLSTAWANGVQRLYTDLTDQACKITFQASEGDEVRQECPGVLGYRLLYDTEDGRDTLSGDEIGSLV